MSFTVFHHAWLTALQCLKLWHHAPSIQYYQFRNPDRAWPHTNLFAYIEFVHVCNMALMSNPYWNLPDTIISPSCLAWSSQFQANVYTTLLKTKWVLKSTWDEWIKQRKLPISESTRNSSYWDTSACCCCTLIVNWVSTNMRRSFLALQFVFYSFIYLFIFLFWITFISIYYLRLKSQIKYEWPSGNKNPQQSPSSPGILPFWALCHRCIMVFLDLVCNVLLWSWLNEKSSGHLKRDFSQWHNPSNTNLQRWLYLRGFSQSRNSICVWFEALIVI